MILWRHGRTAWNESGRVQGQSDIPLDETGRRQARQAAARLASLNPRSIVSSDLSRAADTAGALADVTGLDVQLDARLREMTFGIREGLTHAEAVKRHPDEMRRFAADPSLTLPGAESYAQVGERVAAAIDESAHRVAPGSTWVLVGHGAALRVGVCQWLGFPRELWHRFSGFSNCSWAVLEDRRRGWCITEWNAGSLPEPVLSDEEREG